MMIDGLVYLEITEYIYSVQGVECTARCSNF
jgi:hypothetical protein